MAYSGITNTKVWEIHITEVMNHVYAEHRTQS